MSTLRIMFVCSGNICRSPMAAGLARAFLDAAGADAVVVSAGTLNINGEPAARFGRDAMKEIGIPIDDHYSQGVQLAMLNAADHIVVMAPRHEAAILESSPLVAPKIVRMWDWAEADLQQINDPVGRDLAAFQACRDLLTECVHSWLDAVLSTDQYS